jgi:tRNA1Val (adenine37-N6)-methyltransferase
MHDLCAHKIGTDGVLLGAWTFIPGDAKRILDIGTGSGLIAMMLAQRCTAHIDAIDCDKTAFSQANLNFERSIWKSRLQAFHTSLQHFFPDKKYDVLVCNPPFFKKSMKPVRFSRSMARHDDTLSFDDLTVHAARLLRENGTLSVIIPFNRKDDFLKIAEKHHLNLKRITYVKGNVSGDYKRALVECQASRYKKVPVMEDEMAIEISRNHYTREYMQLTEAFYLRF